MNGISPLEHDFLNFLHFWNSLVYRLCKDLKQRRLYIDVYAQKNIHSDIELLDSTKLKVNSKLNLKDGFDQFSILD